MAEQISAEEIALPARVETEPLKPVQGRIITGMKLSVAAQKRIAACFEQKLGVPVKLTCRVDQRELCGVRVELGEIDAALCSHDSVRDAVALVRDGRLVAWFCGH
ncbi:MAG: F0F1 ATP synthase subunit delta, partial [Clostridia bacterium]